MDRDTIMDDLRKWTNYTTEVCINMDKNFEATYNRAYKSMLESAEKFKDKGTAQDNIDALVYKFFVEDILADQSEKDGAYYIIIAAYSKYLDTRD